MPQLRRNGVGHLLGKVQGERIPSANQPGRDRPPTSTRLSASPESTPEQSEAESPESTDVIVTDVKIKPGATTLKNSRVGFESAHPTAKGTKIRGLDQNGLRRGQKRGNAELQEASTQGFEVDEDLVFERQSHTRKAAYGKSSQSKTQSSQRSSQTKNIHSRDPERAGEQKATLKLPEALTVASLHNSPQRLKTYDLSSPIRDQPARPIFTNPHTIQTSAPGQRTAAEFKRIENSNPEQKDVNIECFDDNVAIEGTFLSSMPSNTAFNGDEAIGGAEPNQHAPDSPAPAGFTRCPVCNDLVATTDAAATMSRVARTFREKMEFCDAHKRKRARDQWEARKYPQIMWEQLPTRLSKLRRNISSLIERRQKSFYHDELETRLESGKNRQAVRNPDTIISYVQQPGYYGSKGGAIIMDHVMKEYSDRIRRQTTKDRVLQLIGVSGYIQYVLVPEIACLLVEVDMGVDDRQARDILKESADIGALLNEDEEEARRTQQELAGTVER